MLARKGGLEPTLSRGRENTAGEQRYTNLTMSRIIFQRPRVVHEASSRGGGVNPCCSGKDKEKQRIVLKEDSLLTFARSNVKWGMTERYAVTMRSARGLVKTGRS